MGTRKIRVRLIGAVGGVAILIVAAGVLALRGGHETPVGSRPSVSTHPVPAPSSTRTVLVSRAKPMPSAHARLLSAMLEEGPMPDRPVMADVLTDTDCAPDANMISRCRNVMRLADRRRVVLRHPHDMRDVPCLTPGERVQLIPRGSSALTPNP